MLTMFMEGSGSRKQSESQRRGTQSKGLSHPRVAGRAVLTTPKRVDAVVGVAVVAALYLVIRLEQNPALGRKGLVGHGGRQRSRGVASVLGQDALGRRRRHGSSDRVGARGSLLHHARQEAVAGGPPASMSVVCSTGGGGMEQRTPAQPCVAGP